MPEITMSDIKLPELKVGDMKLPDDILDRLPDMDDIRDRLSDVDLSNIKLPEVAGVAAITRFVRPEQSRRNVVPWLVVAGAAALFAGWWLATSSVTAPRVRSAADKVRRRIDDMRGVNTDWTELEESTTYWSGESGGWQEGSTGGAGTNEQAMGAGIDRSIVDPDAANAIAGDTDQWGSTVSATQSMAESGVGGTGFEAGSSADRGEAADREG